MERLYVYHEHAAHMSTDTIAFRLHGLLSTLYD